jgi:CRP-like cAMP-binding protein
MKLPRRTYKKGTFLVKEGDTGKEILYILKGQVTVMAKNPNRNMKNTVNTLTHGDLIGELSFFDDRPKSATLVALEETEVIVLDESFFKDIHPDHLRIFKAMAHKIRVLNQRLLENL